MQQPILLQEQVYHNFFDQLQVICGHVSNAVNVMINKAVTGTKFTRRDLKKILIGTCGFMRNGNI